MNDGATEQGEGRKGAVLFGAAEGVRGSIGIGVWLTDVATHEETAAALRADLGGDAYEAAVDEGMRCPPADLYALACTPARPTFSPPGSRTA